MARGPRLPVLNPPVGVRQRRRANGTWRVWWEPRAKARALGFEAVELWSDRPADTRAEGDRLNREVDAALADGRRRAAARSDRTVEALIARYRGSPHYIDKLRPATRRGYDYLLGVIQDKWGLELVAGFDKATMNAWYETCYRSRGKRMAQALLRMMSILFQRAEVEGWRSEGSNPCARLKLVTPPPRHRWASWAEVDACVAAAGALGLQAMADAVLLAVLHGQRPGDVRTARRADFRLARLPGRDAPGWAWEFRRSKRDTDALLPVHDEFLPRLAAILAAPAPADGSLLPDAVTGRMMDADLFAHRWAAVRAEAAKACPSLLAPPLQFRDLRRTFGVMARAGGASDDDTGHVLGNTAATDPRLHETYMPAVIETVARAVAAVRRPRSARGETG
jgi:integrase